MPQPVIDLVAACTAKKPADRPQDFGSIAGTLERVRDDLDAATRALTQVSPAPWPAPARPPWLIPRIRPRRLAPSAFSSPRGPSPQRRSLPALPKLISTSTGPMVLVAAGEFGFGGDKQRTALPAFYIDQTEVPNAEYAKFCQADEPPVTGAFPRG